VSEIPRRLETVVRRRLREIPAVVLLGPRQVGKTTLARRIAATWPQGAVYLDLENAVDARRLTDPGAFLRGLDGRLAIVDEIHRAPALFPELRGIIDERRARDDRAGHFLLLGSASLDLMRQASETLAGRVAYLELGPVDVAELPASLRVDRLWLRGGFPESLLARSDTASLEWRHGFLRSYLERDVPMFGPRLPAATIGRLCTMLAHAQGSMLNQARLAASLAVSAPAVGRYVDLLVDLLLVRRLPAWSGNIGKRLTRAPKIYIRDSGLVHGLLDIEEMHDLLGHPVAGASWEGFAIETLIAAAGDRRRALFYRTEDGAEIDLVLERGGEVEMAIEIKRSTAPTLTRGFDLACEVLRPRERYVVHGGSEAWPMRADIQAVPLGWLVERLSEVPRVTRRRPAAGRPTAAKRMSR
jgi:predicted AAA+ superfamily ATPase